jgi:transcriptional regulator with XRE-family HTH domain
MVKNPKCLQCGKPLTDDQARHGVKYHQPCFGQAVRRGTVSSKPWARFLASKRAEAGVSQNALADRLGMSHAAMSRQLNGANPSVEIVARVRAMYPGEVPDDVETREAKSGENANVQLALLNAARAEERSKRAAKGGEAGKGRPRPLQSGRMRAWHASEAGKQHRQRLVEEFGPRLTEEVRSVKGRIVLELTTFLRDHPELRTRSDALDVLRKRARFVAERADHGLPASAVLEVWRPELRKRGFSVGAGRPARIDWYALDRRKRELEAAGERRVWQVLGPEFDSAPNSLARSYRRWFSTRGTQDGRRAR